MPSNFRLHCFIYRLLSEAEHFQKQFIPASRDQWQKFVSNLDFSQVGGEVKVQWRYPKAGIATYSLKGLELYVRGDSTQSMLRQQERGLVEKEDAIRDNNQDYFRSILVDLVGKAEMALQSEGSAEVNRLDVEAQFHDEWANITDVSTIDVRKMNEACTAPEMRFITSRLGNLSGKRLLDVGCGLGEASVYFALQGAHVTAVDLSEGMLRAANTLAAKNGVAIRTHRAASEHLGLVPTDRFDIIYAGNLLHHVDIEQTVKRLRSHLAPGGILLTWDPLAYNPAINIYRWLAKDVRTPDEHPLTLRDIRMIQKSFGRVETHYFWLTALIIFFIMAVVQRRNPNQERFWKVVVEEGDQWKWLYQPLEKLDRLLLALFPPLRMLCWNVVILASES
jgi:2-polyprenyl-3-methyl-5-hydroxy-6-metoxy-1,4-benzoquinol methylase